MMPLNFLSRTRYVFALTLFWPTVALPLDVSNEEMEALCTGLGELAYSTATKRDAGENLEDVNGFVVQTMSDAADGKVNQSVAEKMVAALALARQPEAGSKDEVARWVYRNCMTTDWLKED